MRQNWIIMICKIRTIDFKRLGWFQTLKRIIIYFQVVLLIYILNIWRIMFSWYAILRSILIINLLGQFKSKIKFDHSMTIYAFLSAILYFKINLKLPTKLLLLYCIFYCLDPFDFMVYIYGTQLKFLTLTTNSDFNTKSFELSQNLHSKCPIIKFNLTYHYLLL